MFRALGVDARKLKSNIGAADADVYSV